MEPAIILFLIINPETLLAHDRPRDKQLLLPSLLKKKKKKEKPTTPCSSMNRTNASMYHARWRTPLHDTQPAED